jgi:cytoskeleton protein RodZ
MATLDRTGADFGGAMRRARETRGVSLRQVAEVTKLSVGVLEALERNEVSRLPGGIFSRGFVRSYAAEIGVDPEAAVQDFLAQFPQDPLPSVSTSEWTVDGEHRGTSRRVALLAMACLALVVLAAAAVYFYFLPLR